MEMVKVLIVEDEDIIRKGITFMMDWEKVGCVIVGEAADGEEGLALIEKLAPDLVVCDIRMPVMDGLEMLQNSLPEKDFEVILLSGYGEFEYAQKAMALGVREYLLKPVDYQKLTEAVQTITARIEEKRQRHRAFETAARGMDMDTLLKGEWLCPGAAKNRHVNAMLDYVAGHYKEKVSLTDLGGEMETSPSYLNTKFKTETGYTFNDYLNRYRIMKAVGLMQGPGQDLRIYEIADAVGFADYKYFIKVFKKYVGHSPQRFLKGAVDNSMQED